MKKLEDRMKQLHRKKSVSEDKLDEATFNYAAARERVRIAETAITKVQAMLKETQITAPFSGVITAKQCEVGQVTSPGKPLLVLEEQSTLKFRTRVKEHDIPHIEPRQKVTITIDALNDLQLQATVSKIIPSGDPSTHAFVVETILPRHDKLYPGMFGKVDFGH